MEKREEDTTSKLNLSNKINSKEMQRELDILQRKSDELTKDATFNKQAGDYKFKSSTPNNGQT